MLMQVRSPLGCKAFLFAHRWVETGKEFKLSEGAALPFQMCLVCGLDWRKAGRLKETCRNQFYRNSSLHNLWEFLEIMFSLIMSPTAQVIAKKRES